jgi:hypothetical protein
MKILYFLTNNIKNNYLLHNNNIYIYIYKNIIYLLKY